MSNNLQQSLVTNEISNNRHQTSKTKKEIKSGKLKEPYKGTPLLISEYKTTIMVKEGDNPEEVRERFLNKRKEEEINIKKRLQINTKKYRK